MARVAPRVPEISEVLCTSCGYVLSGLPETGACPECGQPIAQSLGSERVPTAWDDASTGKKRSGFVSTTAEVIFHPTHFYRTFTVRGSLESAHGFAQLHWWLAGTLIGFAGATHIMWLWYHTSGGAIDIGGIGPAIFAGLWIGFTVLVYLALNITTRIAAKLTTMEATYRGLRLPYPIVLRGLYFHAAHYFPVAAAALIAVVGYQVLLAVHASTGESAVKYLYVLCGLVIVSAIYLFQTYWIGMRNMMYANR